MLCKYRHMRVACCLNESRTREKEVEEKETSRRHIVLRLSFSTMLFIFFFVLSRLNNVCFCTFSSLLFQHLLSLFPFLSTHTRSYCFAFFPNLFASFLWVALSLFRLLLFFLSIVSLMPPSLTSLLLYFLSIRHWRAFSILRPIHVSMYYGAKIG